MRLRLPTMSHLWPTIRALLRKDAVHCVSAMVVLAAAALFLLRATEGNLRPVEGAKGGATATTSALPSDSLTLGEALFTSSRDTLGRGDSMYSALLHKGLSGTQVLDLIKALGRALDLGKVQVGDAYALTFDPVGDVERLEYRPRSDAGKVVIVERDGERLFVRDESEALDTSVVAIHALVTSSLYNAILQETGGAASLVRQFADIFRWQVDFTKDLRRGDSVGFLVEELRKGDLLVGYGRILAAQCRVGRQRYEAVLYTSLDSRSWGYYDARGMSLRKMFMRSPLDYSRMTSGFSTRRFHPILNEYRPHWGIDFAAPLGTPVKATADGIIVFRGWRNGMGNNVEIDHGSGYSTGYLHLSGFAAGMGKGRRVRQGEVIGYVGATGLATGPHVCYRFTKDGRHVDPLSASLPNSSPVSARDRDRFNVLRDQRLAQIDKVMRTGESARVVVMK